MSDPMHTYDPQGSPNPSRKPPRRHRRGTAHTTRRMVLCAILCALSVVILGFGTILEVMDLSASALAAMVILLVHLVYGPRYALLSYAVTGVLGLLFMPQSLAVWTYIGLMGYYPVLKTALDRLPRAFAWVLKLLLFAVVMAGCILIFHFLFLGGQGSIVDSFLIIFGEEGGKTAMAWVVLGLSLFIYVIFDLLLDRLIFIYRIRYHRQIEKWMKP